MDQEEFLRVARGEARAEEDRAAPGWDDRDEPVEDDRPEAWPEDDGGPLGFDGSQDAAAPWDPWQHDELPPLHAPPLAVDAASMAEAGLSAADARVEPLPPPPRPAVPAAGGDRAAPASRPRARATAPTMPANIEAERAILASALIDPNSTAFALGRVAPEDFWDRRLGLVWAAIVALTTARKPVDPISVGAELQRTGKLEAVGGYDVLVSLANFIGSSLSMEHYAQTVARIAVVRRVLQAAHEIQVEAYQHGADPDHVVATAQQRMRQALDRAVGDDARRVGDIVGRVYELTLQARERGGQATGVPSGYQDLDRITLGFHRSDLVILAARPAMGKTSLALNFGLNVAQTTVPMGARAGKQGSVLVFSLEMGCDQLVQRLLSQRARVELKALRSGNISPEEEAALRTAAGELAELSIHIDDTPALTTIDLAARARRLAMREGLDLVIVDYLQLMRGTGGARQSREQEISEISRSMKALAKELDVTVIALSQLNRGLESRADKRPIMSDLRESGAIEQDADIIMFVYRDHVYHKETADPNAAELILAKHRAGETGMVQLRFDGRFTRFYQVDDRFNDEYLGVRNARWADER